MKELWFRVDEELPKDVKDPLFTLASQVCDVILVTPLDMKNARKTKIKVATGSTDGDIFVLDAFDEEKITSLKKTGRTVAVRVTITSKEDETIAVKAANLSADYIILNCPDWKIIPLENLIAKIRGRSKLLVEGSSTDDARLALQTLELGADGVVLQTSEIGELTKTALFTKKPDLSLKLETVKITKVTQIGTGARACVDTCDLMKSGEGLLVGCQSSGLFLVEAEVHQSPYIEPRPFRVNAGPVSLYTLSSPNKTQYLSELKAGNEILIVDRKGRMRSADVCRVKIEWRPLVLIEAEHDGKRFKTIVQNAETIRLVTEDGSKAITNLAVGDKVLAHLAEGGRHFGTLVKEEQVIEH